MLFDDELLYEKKFDDVDEVQEYLDSLSEEEKNELRKKFPPPDFNEFLKKLEEYTTSEPLPEKEKNADAFISTAKDISEMYEMDIKIQRHDTHISVELSFDGGVAMKYLKDVFVLADDIAFFANTNGRKITICIDYYTHAVFYNGRRIN